MAASSRRRRAESKILPQIAHFVADRGVGVFEIGKHVCSSLRQFVRAKLKARRDCCDQRAGVGEEIAVAGVEGKVVLVGEVDADAGSLVARCCGRDSAVGIDGRCDSGVGGAKDPAVIFDGAHAHHVQVLPGSAGVAVPSVVGDVDEDVGPCLSEVADLVAEDGLVADEGAVGVAACVEDGALLCRVRRYPLR